MEKYWFLVFWVTALALLRVDVTNAVDCGCYVHDAHPCNRDCVVGHHRECHYRFEVDKYYTLSKACYDCPTNQTDCCRQDCVTADGVQRLITTINRRIPGPTINVCEGDTVKVDVVNKMSAESCTIHWHGIQQFNNQWADGVPQVTQCPIQPGASFQYIMQTKFRARGTNFYHSHSGTQRNEGVFGAFVVRKPRHHDPHSSLYDHDEHIMVVTDWTSKLTMEEKLELYLHTGGDNFPNSILVNGKGRRNDVPETKTMPLEKFCVKKDHRYRFRIIDASGLPVPIAITIDNHELTLISADGYDTQPTKGNTVVLGAGERMDVIVTTNQPIGNYWIKLRGLGNGEFRKTFGTAILHYDGAPDTEPNGEITYDTARNPGRVLNAVNVDHSEGDPVNITINRIKSYEKYPYAGMEPDLSLMLTFNFDAVDNPAAFHPPFYTVNNVQQKYKTITPQVDHITDLMLPSPPLTQYHDIPQDLFCDYDLLKTKDCAKNFCSCSHVIQLPFGKLVEVILVDEGSFLNTSHPIHLHGHTFYVVSLGKLGDSTTGKQVADLNATGEIPLNEDHPIELDTIMIPDGGFIKIRFKADNPGFWIMHCHLEIHVEMGMRVIFQVGDPKHMPPPPQNFPKCGCFPDNSLAMRPIYP